MANIKESVTFSINSSDGWEDLPENVAGIFENQRYSGSYMIQKYTVYNKGSLIYDRIVNYNNGAIFRPWMLSTRTLAYRILALGDSICRGGRNSGKGFVGDIGEWYINMGVGGATISNVHSTYGDSIHGFADADNIPNQLTSYYSKSNSEINAAFGRSKFSKVDAIIADGGINDYFKGASLGTLSSVPVTSDEEAALLDRSKLINALEYLFYNMIKLYPEAQRFFVITHKTKRTSSGKYCPTTVGSGGYTQEQMHDAIVDCCHMYGVKVIDVYKEGMMDTIFPQYKTTASSWSDASITDYCDNDGVHPLEYGYQQVYIPLVRAALFECGTRK